MSDVSCHVKALLLAIVSTIDIPNPLNVKLRLGYNIETKAAVAIVKNRNVNVEPTKKSEFKYILKPVLRTNFNKMKLLEEFEKYILSI